jgi:hypothetical protein
MKTETKHTQGPWKVLENGKEMGKHCVSTTSDAPVQAVICEINTKSIGTNDAIRLANARLISAAPELLAALREIESKLTALLCDRVLDSTLPEFFQVRDARNSARAAIVKAEGNA